MMQLKTLYHGQCVKLFQYYLGITGSIIFSMILAKTMVWLYFRVNRRFFFLYVI